MSEEGFDRILPLAALKGAKVTKDEGGGRGVFWLNLDNGRHGGRPSIGKSASKRHYLTSGGSGSVPTSLKVFKTKDTGGVLELCDVGVIDGERVGIG